MQTAHLARGNFNSGAALFRQTVPDAGSTLYRSFMQQPDIVNGETDGFRFMFISEGLAREYHWIPSDVLPVLPVAPTEAQYVEHVTAAATIQLRLMRGDAGPTPLDAMKACILAVGRTSIKRTWGVQDADIVANQMWAAPAPPRARNQPPAALPVAGDAPPAAEPAALGYRYPGGIGTNAQVTAALGDVNGVMRDHSEAFLPLVTQAAVGMPPCNGYVIVNTMVHHYVEPHKAACDAIIDQLWKGDAQLPNGLDMTTLKDLVCHKTAHPIDTPKLVWMARSTVVKERLMALGLGSAAVRLPASFNPERTANAFKALISKVAGISSSANVAVSTGPVEALCAAVTTAIHANPNNAGIKLATELVEAFKTARGADLAWVAGYVTAQMDDANVPQRSRTVVNAYSVKNIIEENSASYAEGSDHYALALKWRKTQAKEGKLAGHGLFGAAVPKAFAPADAPAPAANTTES